jgi:hypothetical protein
MERRYAERLQNRDEVEVRVGSNEWIRGYVVGDALIRKDGVFVDVQTKEEGFVADVRHTDLR